MNFLTDFADQAVMLPLILCMAAMLALLGWPRGGIAWVLATAGTFGLMLLLKLVFLGCGSVLAWTGISSPSGHAAAAALVAGGITTLFTGSRPWVMAASILAGFVIGVTRVHLGVHSIEEVILGGTIGLCGAIALSVAAGPPPAPRLLPLALVVGVVVIATHGTRLPAESAIRHTASLLRLIVPWCQPAPPVGS